MSYYFKILISFFCITALCVSYYRSLNETEKYKVSDIDSNNIDRNAVNSNYNSGLLECILESNSPYYKVILQGSNDGENFMLIDTLFIEYDGILVNTYYKHHKNTFYRIKPYAK